MSGTLKTILIVLVLIVVIILDIVALKGIFTPKYPEVDHWETYTIQPGDTLWNIVPHNDNYDIRDIIYMVKKHNNIGTNLEAYSIIELPVW